MKLRDLFGDDAAIDPRAEAVVVTGLAVDSRAVKPGDVFFALAGSRTDGARFIDQAHCRRRGGNRGRPCPAGRPAGAVCRHAESAPRAGACRGAILSAAARDHRRRHRHQRQDLGRGLHPADLAALGHASASIGTIGLVSPKRTVYGSLTTPDPIALHRQLDEIASDGVTHLALEASSHGLDQYRLDGVRIGAGGFTNLSRDHMDYHPDVAHYLAAKLRLFRDLVAAEGAAVISADHDCSQAVIDAARMREVCGSSRSEPGDGAGEGIRLLGSRNRRASRRSSRSNIADAAHRCGCRWSANSRSRMRWSPPALQSVPAASRKRCLPHSKSRRRQGPAGTGRRTQRRADLCRLRPQARRAGEGAAGVAALREAPARRGVRRRRRPRCRQASADGRDCRRQCRLRHHYRRQSAQRRSRPDPLGDPGARQGREATSATAPRRSGPRLPASSRAMRC